MCVFGRELIPRKSAVTKYMPLHPPQWYKGPPNRPSEGGCYHCFYKGVPRVPASAKETYFSELQDRENAYMEDGEDALLEAYIEDAENLPDMGEGSSCHSADSSPRNYCRHQLDALSDDAYRFYLVTTASAIETEDINLALAFQDHPDLMADD